MSTPLKALAFLVALVAVFALAWGVGRVVGPVSEPAPTHENSPADH